MANNEFKRIEEFIDGFTRNGPTPENYIYDGTFWGIEFLYKNVYYRITRDIIGVERDEWFKKKFGNIYNIKFFIIPVEKYPDASEIPHENYIGTYKDVYDLIDNGKIDGIPLREILVSEETEILGMD